MKIYAIVIGRKNKHRRYISQAPFPACGLAVYEEMKDAREARKKILKDCGHKDVFIIRFLPLRKNQNAQIL